MYPTSSIKVPYSSCKVYPPIESRNFSSSVTNLPEILQIGIANWIRLLERHENASYKFLGKESIRLNRLLQSFTFAIGNSLIV